MEPCSKSGLFDALEEPKELVESIEYFLFSDDASWSARIPPFDFFRVGFTLLPEEEEEEPDDLLVPRFFLEPTGSTLESAEEEEPEDLLVPRFFLEPTGSILEPAEEEEEEPEEPEEALATTDDFAEPVESGLPGELEELEELEPRSVSGPPPPFDCFPPRFILQVYL